MDADTEIQEGGTAMNSDKGMECCGSCAFFQNEDITGNGWCGYHNTGATCFTFCRNYKEKEDERLEHTGEGSLRDSQGQRMDQITENGESKRYYTLDRIRTAECPDCMKQNIHRLEYDMLNANNPTANIFINEKELIEQRKQEYELQPYT